MGRGLMCALTLLSATTAHAAEPAGYVLVVQGRWLEKGQSTPLTVGAPVSAGVLIVAPSPATGDRIAVIAARSGAVLMALRCDEPAACRKPLLVPIPPVASRSDDWLKRAFAALADRPDRYVATLSRTAQSADDAVLVWDAGSLRLEPVFAGRPEGLFEIILTPLACPSEGRCVDAPVTMTVVWSPRTPAPTVDLPQGGLFELALRRLGDAATLPPERSWILAVRPGEEVAARERLRAAAALAEGWGGAVEPEARRAFIRAMLATSSP